MWLALYGPRDKRVKGREGRVSRGGPEEVYRLIDDVKLYHKYAILTKGKSILWITIPTYRCVCVEECVRAWVGGCVCVCACLYV